MGLQELIPGIAEVRYAGLELCDVLIWLHAIQGSRASLMCDATYTDNASAAEEQLHKMFNIDRRHCSQAGKKQLSSLIMRCVVWVHASAHVTVYLRDSQGELCGWKSKWLSSSSLKNSYYISQMMFAGAGFLEVQVKTNSQEVQPYEFEVWITL